MMHIFMYCLHLSYCYIETGNSKWKTVFILGKLGENSDEVFGHKFFDLDDQVKVWSDFLGTHLHPRSAQLIQNHILDW